MNVFETDRLKLRQMNVDDKENLMRIFADPIAMEYYPSTYSEEKADQWIQWNLNNYKEHGCGLWICELKDSGIFVGQCGIVPQLVEGIKEMEIGYLFVREHWGKGYATEVAIGSKSHGFEKLHFTRLISMIYKPNTPSIRVAERMGMQYEKTTDRNGRETLIYSITTEC
ncbi:GNAT family N-acetyltransferase [Cytobacillus sp. FJAT-54145]|uniref:GNAT family N-acetyltransferase n=1 Tax=Cytobacillus spartinae TaxID=3299023 RepID=A0ABW6KBK7_9BACI